MSVYIKNDKKDKHIPVSNRMGTGSKKPRVEIERYAHQVAPVKRILFAVK